MLAATPLAAWANVLKACAVSLAATPTNKQQCFKSNKHEEKFKTISINKARASGRVMEGCRDVKKVQYYIDADIFTC